MAAAQDVLREACHGGQTDRMSPWEQARALALREASREIYDGQVKVPWVAARRICADNHCTNSSALSTVTLTGSQANIMASGVARCPSSHLKRGDVARRR